MAHWRCMNCGHEMDIPDAFAEIECSACEGKPMKSTKELSEELERLKEWIESFAEPRLKRIELFDGSVSRVIEKLKTQEDKIKELKERIFSQSTEQKSLQEKVEKLERVVRTLDSWSIEHIDDQEKRFARLESKPQDCRVNGLQKETDFWLQTHEERLADLERRVHNVEPQDKQDSRREVIKRARDVVDAVWCEGSPGTRILTAIQKDIILQALTLAEQSLEGGEE